MHTRTRAHRRTLAHAPEAIRHDPKVDEVGVDLEAGPAHVALELQAQGRAAALDGPREGLVKGAQQVRQQLDANDLRMRMRARACMDVCGHVGALFSLLMSIHICALLLQ